MGLTSNHVSYGISMSEVGIISGVVWGFAFMQFIFNQELIFYDELCLEDCIEDCSQNATLKTKLITELDQKINAANLSISIYDKLGISNFTCDNICSKEFRSQVEDNSDILCEAVSSNYSFIFALFSFTCSLSGLVFEPIQQKFGNFWTRFTMCCFSTIGSVMLIFYQMNPYYITIGWNLMGFSTFIYLTSNISEQCARFPGKANLTISLVNGLYNVSSGMFLIVQMIYPSVSAETMLTTFAMLNILPWIKTFFFTPRVGHESSMSAYESSMAGYLMGNRGPETTDEMEMENLNEPEVKGPSLKSSILSRDNIASGLFFIIMNVRAVSFPGWCYPWLEWTFSDNPEKDDLVPLCLKIFGFTFFASFFMAFIPEMITQCFAKKNKKRASENGLLAMIVITAVLTSAFSFQMAENDTSFVKAVLVMVEFAFVRAFYYIYKAMYYYEHFPAEHFSGLYLCNTILCGFGNFVCDPIFSNFILDGDNIADAHFDTVSIALAGFFTISNILFLLYHCCLSLPAKHARESEDEQIENIVTEKQD